MAVVPFVAVAATAAAWTAVLRLAAAESPSTAVAQPQQQVYPTAAVVRIAWLFGETCFAAARRSFNRWLSSHRGLFHAPPFSWYLSWGRLLARPRLSRARRVFLSCCVQFYYTVSWGRGVQEEGEGACACLCGAPVFCLP